mgnify:CR=1 FL=1
MYLKTAWQHCSTTIRKMSKWTIFAAPNTLQLTLPCSRKLNKLSDIRSVEQQDDVKCFAAVATSLNNTYPDAVRSKNLYNIVIKGMKNTRQPQAKALEIPQEKNCRNRHHRHCFARHTRECAQVDWPERQSRITRLLRIPVTGRRSPQYVASRTI